MSKVEKKLDATMDCGSCGLRLICRSKTYEAYDNHPERTVLQWQNDNGGAHYKWIGPEKFKCVDENGKDIPPKLTDAQKIKADQDRIAKEAQEKQPEPKTGNGLVKKDLMKDDEEPKKDDTPLDVSTTKLIQNEAILLWKTRRVVETTIKKLEKDPHGGMIGQFTEIIYKKHFGEKAHE